MIVMICDLCKNEIKKDDEFFVTRKKHLCGNCLKICKEIINNSKLSDVSIVYLNEYKELKEQGLI